MLQPFLQGTAFTATLLVSIGPQNTHVLRQGLPRRWVFTTAAVCVLCDILLFSLGAGGSGKPAAWRVLDAGAGLPRVHYGTSRAEFEAKIAAQARAD